MKFFCIHGISPKLQKEKLFDNWVTSINDGLNIHNIEVPKPKFHLFYWANVIYKYNLHDDEDNKFDDYYDNQPYINIAKTDPDESIIGFLEKYKNKCLKSILRTFADDSVPKELEDPKSISWTVLSHFLKRTCLKDLEIYFNRNSTQRDIILASLKDEFLNFVSQTDPREEVTILAHSMGSIIMYDLLTSPEFEDIELPNINFINIGSALPLKIIRPFLLYNDYNKESTNSLLIWPHKKVITWFNVSDSRDIVACDDSVRDDVEIPEGVVCEDVECVNLYPEDPHKSYGYLQSRKVSSILKDLLNK